jgi:ribosomal protein S27E
MKMKFECPICKASGNISENDLEHPVTRTTCPDCGTILLINPETGKVDAHKSPLKDSPAFKTISHNRSADSPAPLLSMRPGKHSGRDWTAAVVVAIIVLVLISAGIYFVLNLDII